MGSPSLSLGASPSCLPFYAGEHAPP